MRLRATVGADDGDAQQLRSARGFFASTVFDDGVALDKRELDEVMPRRSCRTGTLTPGGRHFVRYWTSHLNPGGAPVGRKLNSLRYPISTL